MASAADHTWTGEGADSKWSTIGNWEANFRPYNSNTTPVRIIFPVTAKKFTNVCDLANLQLNSIFFNGSNYNVSLSAPGNPIALAGLGGGLYSAGINNNIQIPFILDSPVLNFSVSPGKDLQVSRALTGSGGFQKIGRGSLTLVGISDNLFTGTLTVLGGKLYLQKGAGRFALSGPLVVGDTAGSTEPNGATDSEVIMGGDQQMPTSTPLTVNPDAKYTLNGHTLAIGSLTMVGNSGINGAAMNSKLILLGNLSVGPGGPSGGSFEPYISGDFTLGGATRTFDVTAQNLNISSNISNGGATAGVVKTGSGSIWLSGLCSYTGGTVINQGTLKVSGSIAGSNVTVNAPGTLSGYGATGPVSIVGATLNPRAYAQASNIPTRNLTTQSVAFNAASALVVHIDSNLLVPAPLLTVAGTVQLGGCKLSASLQTTGYLGLIPVIGDKFTLINNDGTDAISGIFDGLTEGALFYFSDRKWKITYLGGTGNDVVLTLIDVESSFRTDSISIDKPSGIVTILGTGNPGTNYKMETSTDLKVWTYGLSNILNNNGALEYKTTLNPNEPKRFYRFVQP